MKLASVTGFIAVRSLLPRFPQATPLLGRIAAVVVACVLVAACSSGGTPPVSDRSRIDNSTERRAARAPRLNAGSYRVVAGDTLYSIAWRHQRDFRDLAALNRIPPPFDIYPGQVLTLKGKPTRTQAARAPSRASSKPHPLSSTRTKPQSGTASTAVTSVGAVVERTPAQTKPRAAASVARPQAPKAVAPSTGPVQLRWPSSGTRVQAPTGNTVAKTSGKSKASNTIDFALRPGAAIRAAGAGQVVFAKASLAGYRQFVILKHNDTWLSSYGFNAPLQVREGQRVAAGATLATLPKDSSVGANERVLRFEVRKNGTAVNPELVIRP